MGPPSAIDGVPGMQEDSSWRPRPASDARVAATPEQSAAVAPLLPRRRRATPLWHVESLAEIVIAVPLSPYELLRLALRLLGYCGLGYKWALQLLRLCVYALLLLPGFLQMLRFYFFSPLVRRDIPYGRQPRQLLDLYVPAGAGPGETPVPVVVFVTGGAWTIGYKAWGASLAQRLCESGLLVACLDYRNFPQGSATEMLEDVNTGVAWTVRHAARLGGDPDSVFLVGQSAGAQLALLAVLGQAEQAASGEAVAQAVPVWQPLDVRGFVGVSGAYDLEGLGEHLHRRGLYRGMLDAIMSLDGQPAYARLSPLAVARRLASEATISLPGAQRKADSGHQKHWEGFAADGKTNADEMDGCNASSGGGCFDSADCTAAAGSHNGGGAWRDGAAATGTGGGVARFLPPMVLLHGTADKTVPHASSVLMHGALTALGVPCSLKLFPGKTHTDLLLEDAFRGGEDVLTEAILSAITGQSPGPLWYRPTCPGPLVSLASAVCPF